MKRKKLFNKLLLVFIFLSFYNESFNLPASNEKCLPFMDSEIKKIPFFVNGKKGDINLLKINPELFRVKSIKTIFSEKNPLLNKIMTNGKMSCGELAYFLNSNNPEISIKQAKDISKLYINESRTEGVNHDIAFCQMCLETGFMKFNNVVNRNQNNFCGLGTINKNVRGNKFDSEKDGIRAHIQHLKAYASNESLINDLLDKRFYFVKRGISPTIDNLSGRWAADPEYGKKIKSLLLRLRKS